MLLVVRWTLYYADKKFCFSVEILIRNGVGREIFFLNFSLIRDGYV